MAHTVPVYLAAAKDGAFLPAQELSSRERQMLRLFADGYSYESAAAQMHVSINTIRNYIRAVYEKLHVHSKSEAVGKALRNGLL